MMVFVPGDSAGGSKSEPPRNVVREIEVAVRQAAAESAARAMADVRMAIATLGTGESGKRDALAEAAMSLPERLAPVVEMVVRETLHAERDTLSLAAEIAVERAAERLQAAIAEVRLDLVRGQAASAARESEEVIPHVSEESNAAAEAPTPEKPETTTASEATALLDTVLGTWQADLKQTLAETLAAQHGALAAVEAKLGQLTAEVELVGDRLGVVGEVSRQVSDLGQQLDTFGDRLGVVGEVSRQVSGLGQQLDTFGDRLGAVDEIRDQLGHIDHHLETLGDRLPADNLSERLNGLQLALSALSSQLAHRPEALPAEVLLGKLDALAQQVAALQPPDATESAKEAPLVQDPAVYDRLDALGAQMTDLYTGLETVAQRIRALPVPQGTLPVPAPRADSGPVAPVAEAVARQEALLGELIAELRAFAADTQSRQAAADLANKAQRSHLRAAAKADKEMAERISAVATSLESVTGRLAFSAEALSGNNFTLLRISRMVNWQTVATAVAVAASLLVFASSFSDSIRHLLTEVPYDALLARVQTWDGAP